MLADLELKKKQIVLKVNFHWKDQKQCAVQRCFYSVNSTKDSSRKDLFFPEFDESSGLLWSEFQCSLICFFCNTDQDKSGYLITCSKVAARKPLISEYNPSHMLTLDSWQHTEWVELLMMEVRTFSDDLTELLTKLNSENVHTLAQSVGLKL